MSIFTHPASHISFEHLQQLLADKAVENVRLEFKRDIPNKDEVLKKISSFANTFGGIVVIGAEASSKDGRLIALPGVEPERGYKQTIAQFCFEGASPPLIAETSDPIPVPGQDEKVCYVIRVSESDVAPHFLNGRKGVYVRTDEFSSRFEARLAKENELRFLLDRGKLACDRREGIVQRARQRFRTLADRKYSELTRHAITSHPANERESLGSFVELAVVPRFPVAPLCEHESLRQALRETRVQWRGVGFPRDTHQTLSQHESEIVVRPGSNFSILEANIWGMLFYATEIDRNQGGVAGVHLNRFIGHLLVFLGHASRMVPKLGLSGPVIVQMALRSICGVPWLYYEYGSVPMHGPTSELDDDAEFSISTDSETLAACSDGVAKSLLRYAFFATNWAGTADSPEKLDEMIRRGHEFNNAA
jgi:hypothetical protein